MCYTGTRTLLDKVINNMNKNLKGSIMVFIAGIAWGLSGVCGQFLMSRGMNVSQLISMRLLISGTVLTAIAATKYRENLVKVLRSKGALVGILLFAALGFLINQYSYLVAIDYTNAGTATVLQYMSPIVVLFFVALKERRIPEINEFLAIFFAVLGTFIIVTHGRLDGLAITPKGLVFGLLSAVTAAFCVVLPAKYVREYGSFPVIGLGMLMGGTISFFTTQAWQYPLVLNQGNLIGLFGIIGIGTILNYSLFFMGIAIIGSVKGSLMAAVEPISSVVFAVILMQDIFYPMDFLGMLLIIVAVLLISLRDLIALRRRLR